MMWEGNTIMAGLRKKAKAKGIRPQGSISAGSRVKSAACSGQMETEQSNGYRNTRITTEGTEF